MSKAKINSVSYDELRINVQSAVDMLTEVDTLWGDRFEDLYYAFITSGYLEDLYEDAKSNYYTLKKTVSAIGNVATGALLGCYFGPIGGIIGAVIGLIFGIVEFCKTDPVWITASKEAFEQLLTDCVYGNNDCYIGITNIGTKLMNVQLSLEEIRTKVNEFNYMYASLEESMNELGLNGTMTDDGVLLSVDTEITIDGQTKTTSVSEALNAFYTYQNTVMASRIEAQILADQGFEIDYDALVKNANGFMVNTLDSGLYSREFVLAVMPNYSPDVTGATDAAAAGLGISTSDFQSALSQASSMLGIGAGLVGAGFIGSIGSQMGGDTVCPKCGLPVGQCTCPQDTGTGTQPTDPQKPDDTDKKDDTQKPDDTGKKDDTGTTGTPTVKDETTSGPDKTVPGGTTGTTGTTGGTSGGGTTIINNYYYGTEDPNKKPDESKPGDEVDEEKEEFSNEVEIPEISKSKIPEKLEDEVIKDYDDIARREYESNKEEIAERRAEIRDDVDHAYSTGNYSSIKSQLKEYGYSEPEINALLNDRDKLTTALITGDQKEAMAARAMELAKEDGVKDFESSYSEPAEYSDLADGTANSLVANMSDNKEVSKAFDNMTDAQTAYKESVEEATVAVEAVAAAKTTMTDLETKFTEKFGTADTSKWDEESAKEYKDAVKDYNKKVEEAEEKLEAKDEAKEEYEEAKEEYIEAKEEFEAEIKENYRESEAHSDAAERAPGSGVVPDDRYTGNGQYPNNGYPNNGYPNNGYPQNGTTGGVVGGTIEGANTVEGGGGIVGLTPPDTVLYGTNTVTNPDGTVAPMIPPASSNDAAMQTAATQETAMYTSDATMTVDTANTHDQATTVEITRDANGNPIANVTISDEDFLRSVLMDEERDKANNNNN